MAQALTALAMLGGCAPSHPMPIRHVIVADLFDPADSREFENDAFQLMFIPGVSAGLAGPGLPTGQPEALPCGAAVVLDLTNEIACVQLQEQPAYKALLDKWKLRARSVKVLSFGPRCEKPEQTKASP